jgi:signal transduction histidine kinase/ligand-binding sensor domain-containing protein
MKLLLFSLLLWLSIVSSGSSQFENFISFNTGNGMLTHNTVEAIARDSFGYVWVGTNFGLNRLDGYKTVNYLSEPANQNSLSSNFIKSLFVDSENDLWVGTIGGNLDKFDRETNSFRRYSNDKQTNNNGSLNISAIAEDKNGNIWIGTIGNGVCCFNKKTGKFKKIEIEKYDPDQRTLSNVNKLYCDNKGNIWVGMNQSEIFKIDPSSERVSFHGLTKNHSGYSEVGSIKGIAQLRNGIMLFSTWNGSLFKLDPSTDSHITLFADRQFFGNQSLTDVFVDKNDMIWVSTWGNGLFKFDFGRNEKQHFQRNKNLLNSLGSNSINTLFLDRLNNLWAGLTDNGISMLSLREKVFKTLSIGNGTSSLPNEFNTYSILRDKNDILWIGTRGQGLIKFNLKTNKTKIFSWSNFEGLNNNSILTLKNSSDGKLWVGTDGGFLAKFDPATEKMTNIEHLIDDWSGAVFSIVENDHFVWCGTWGGGIKKVDKSTLKYTSVNFDEKDQFKNSVFDLELRDTTLWIANIGIGLIRYNVNSRDYKVYSQSSGFREFPKERITDLFFENDSLCWISTDGAGLFLFNAHNETIVNYSALYPLPSNIIQSAVSDARGNIWIASISGISMLNRETNQCFNFDKSNGLLNNQLNKSALYFDSVDNIIYTGGVDGINYVDPSTVFIDSTSNRVVFTDLKIMGKTVSTCSKTTIYPIDISKVINLFRNDKVVTIHFSSFEFNPSPKNKYHYKLEGFDKEWSEIPYSKNFVQYTNLYPGSYRFKARAVNNDGIVSNSETTLKIEVHPAFWQTLLFKGFLLVLIIFLIYRYVKSRYKRLIISKLILERKVAERTAEIQLQKEKIEQQNHLLERANQSKDRFFSIISHDLRNPVTNIHQLIQVIILQYNSASNEKILNYLELLKKSSSGTLELLDDLLVWARTQTNRIEIKKTYLALSEIFDSVLITCQPLAEKKNIDIILPLTHSMKVHIDKNSLLTTLRNLITNAIKFSYPGSKIMVTLDKTEDSIVFHVTDFGNGMTNEEVDSLFKIEKLHSKPGTLGETGSGLGLILCHEFLALNGEKIWVKSTPGQGSVFSFSVSNPVKSKT